MELSDLEWIEISPWMTFTDLKMRGAMAIAPKLNFGRGIGVDPGRNFGVAVIDGSDIRVYWGTFPKGSAESYGVMAYNHILGYKYPGWPAVVEGAAFHKQYGQVMLAYSRFGFYLGLFNLHADVEIVPPATIRKGAFGHGRKYAREIWPTLNTNAAAAVGCGLYAAGWRDGVLTDK